MPDGPPVPDGAHPASRKDLRADCERCFGLCCVAPAFSRSADFAIDKPAGRPCPNLAADFGCSIHDRLRQRGFPGCTVFDCFGAGQKVAQVTFGGRDWRRTPEIADRMFAVFPIVRGLNELLWYLVEARTLPAARTLHDDLDRAVEETERLSVADPDVLLDLDVDAHRREVGALLLRASELARSGVGHRRAELRGADLIGKDLRRTDLRGANLRGAYLVGADLRGTDLRLADVTGADLRAADVRGADLSGSLFLVQAQLDAAKGGPDTGVPPTLTAPAHWPG